MVAHTLELMSFGYRYGKPDIPTDGPSLPLIIDVTKKIRNPWNIPGLREKNGLDPEVQAVVRECPGYDMTMKTLSFWLSRRSKIYIGCVGGKHRSVAVVEMLAKELQAVHPNWIITTSHRDLEKQ